MSSYWSFGSSRRASVTRLAIIVVVLVAFGYLLVSWTNPRPSPTTHHNVDQQMIDNLTRNLSRANASMTEDSSEINSLQKTSTQPSTNVISRDDDEHVEKSNGDVLLTKKYVSGFHSPRIELCLTRDLSPLR